MTFSQLGIIFIVHNADARYKWNEDGGDHDDFCLEKMDDIDGTDDDCDDYCDLDDDDYNNVECNKCCMKLWEEDQEDWKKCCSNMHDSSVEPQLPTSISTTTEKMRPPPPCEQQGGCAKDGMVWLVPGTVLYTYVC